MNQEQKQEKVVLLESRHPHYLTANKIEKKVLDRRSGTEMYLIEGPGIVTHGEHGTIKTESHRVIKYVQQEIDPLTNSIINAFD